MSSVIYHDKRAEETNETDLSPYTKSDEFKFATAVLRPFLDSFIEDGYATADKNNQYFIQSTKNSVPVGFLFEFDKESKRLVSVVLTINGAEYEYLTLMDLTTLSTNEDIVFPVCLALDVS